MVQFLPSCDDGDRTSFSLATTTPKRQNRRILLAMDNPSNFNLLERSRFLLFLRSQLSRSTHLRSFTCPSQWGNRRFPLRMVILQRKEYKIKIFRFAFRDYRNDLIVDWIPKINCTLILSKFNKYAQLSPFYLCILRRSFNSQGAKSCILFRTYSGGTATPSQA